MRISKILVPGSNPGIPANLMSKKQILILIIIFTLALLSRNFFRDEEASFVLTEVYIGTISQEVSETGQVKKGDKINLSFKSAGQIESIYIEVGQEVNTGQILAKLETSKLEIQLKEAKSALIIAQAKLDKLLTGSSIQEIKVAQTKVDNEETDLKIAEQNLDDAYQDALNVLQDSFLKTYNAQNSVDTVQRNYFTENNQEGIVVREEEEKIRAAVFQIKSSLDTIKETGLDQDIETALSQVKDELADISDGLKVIREICEMVAYRDLVSSVDKTSLNTERDNINDVLTDIVNAQQTIIAKKLAVITAQGELQKAKDDLSLLTAPARQEDITLYEAQLDQVQAQVDILENQIEDTNLRSPVKGQIAKIEKRTGEITQSQNTIITLLPADPFKIEVDIYEEDIVMVKINNPVDIFLIAFPDATFPGRIISIDPAEKLIEGVVYYKVIIIFEETPEGVRPGMTADLIIKVNWKENVLIIPEDAIEEKNDQQIVKIFENEVIEEKEIKTGLLGSDDMIEVISGLEEGQQVILLDE